MVAFLNPALSVRPPAAEIAFNTSTLSVKEYKPGLLTSPKTETLMVRKFITVKLTWASFMILHNCWFISCLISSGVFPTALISFIKGKETIPSGRTVIMLVNSG